MGPRTRHGVPVSTYYRPVPLTDGAFLPGAHPIAGGQSGFTHAERLTRGAAPVLVPAAEIPADILDALTLPRAPLVGVTLDRPRLMGILNITPDSFSDGGDFHERGEACRQAARLIDEGADFLDIGGESTRPGAATVPVNEEIDRTAPVIATIGNALPISIDTRKAAVARAALTAGAAIVNDVSALTYDPGMAVAVAETGAPLILMHAQGDPATMQADPRYDDVLLDVFDYLASRLAVAEAAGIARARLVVDPGIGFGKTLDHNLSLLSRVSLFHALGVPVLVGASRKRFIGTLTGVDAPRDRAAGSIAIALNAASQGVQILRIHDMAWTRQALVLQKALLS